ncbi:hypothetical protein IEU95_11765 [Hoyosella rhizosphaerae]|uniref:Uncharacterized protein n=1 Tax=Hoyosella rhizosphaerae TaxID=1755582 RepID=A0A916UAG6_9ACTN|nr:hypothetical protein [Hoyosella rhizosphaerae]MBN4927510.1 hypothetical protein [Hoyosella rhizosphaerae]GGC63928.1 hypothetical protein GCM10011410_15460 [Hoyosella rhizosphaerae]
MNEHENQWNNESDEAYYQRKAARRGMVVFIMILALVLPVVVSTYFALMY